MITLLTLASALAAGLLMTRVFKILKLNFPDVTAYLVAGIIIGPYVLGRLGISGLGFVNMNSVMDLSIISNVALGFIAFTIGNEFRLSQLKATGKTAFVVATFGALGATLVIDVALIALHFAIPDKLPISVAITLGAIASATAPAATLMVVRQYKAKGPVTSTLLPVVAIDDAIGLVIFAASFGIAKALENGSYDIFSIVVEPVIEIVASLILGALAGLLLSFIEKFFWSNTNRMSLSITFVLLTAALSMLKIPLGSFTLGFSPLLVCMMLGTMFCNKCNFSGDLMDKVDKWTAPLFLLFFVLSGAELELGVFADIGIVSIGLVYFLGRCAGKYYGAEAGCRIMKCDPNVQKYLGITLLPQAGVALGMSVTAMALPEGGELVRNITLFAVLIYEIIGPSLTKTALLKAGEILPVGEDIKTRRASKKA